MDFERPPEPLTSRQRTVFVALAVLCALSRLLARARTLWDWDEALFTMAMRDYNVTLHHPHPPGFPVYIAMGKIARLFIGDDFRALQSVNLVAAMLVFPAVYLFARELRLRFRTSIAAAALFAFFPNVWFFGGGAFSDIPSIVLVLFAVTFLLRGTRSRSSYFIGTLLLALAIGIRPQNLLIGLFPGLLATWKRRWWEVLAALVLGVVIVGAAFGAAVHASGSLHEYTRIVREHADYIARVDSFRSEGRPPLWRVADRFFVKQYQANALSIVASFFALISIIGSMRDRNRSMLWNALTFVPFAIFAWLMLDRYSISRFSIGYQPMFALLAADGIRRLAKQYEGLVAGVLILAFCVYTAPALTSVRQEVSPTVAAAQKTAQVVRATHEKLFVGFSMLVFMDLVAPDVPYTRVVDDRAVALDPSETAWLLAEVTTTAEEGFFFRRARGSLWNIARRHYFEIKLAQLSRRAGFVAGWEPPEESSTEQSRWMGARSMTVLPPTAGETLLRLQFVLPDELIARHATVTVKVNGTVLGQVGATEGLLEREFHATPAAGRQPNVLELTVDHTIPAADGAPERGLRLRSLSWGPA